MRIRRKPRNAAATPVAIGLIAAAVLSLGISTAGQSIAQSQAKATANREEPVRSTDDQAGIEKLLKKVTTAYNKGDAEAISGLFQDDAILIDGEGVEIQGRPAVEKHYEAAFAGGPPAEISAVLKSARFPRPNVASVHGEFRLLDSSGTVFAVGRFGLIAAREKDEWKIAELRDHSIEMVERTEEIDHLKDLEWLLGDWVDESRDLKIESTVRWAEGRKYLIRTYSVRVPGQSATTATQWIGWDPRTDQIRSWIFDSDGGFGEGLWTRSNRGWVVKTTGVLPDGAPTSATIIIDSIGKHTVQIRSVNRIIGGRIHADLNNIVMVRKPPAPNSAGSETRSESETKRD